jgi:hypothetical protein
MGICLRKLQLVETCGKDRSVVEIKDHRYPERIHTQQPFSCKNSRKSVAQPGSARHRASSSETHSIPADIFNQTIPLTQKKVYEFAQEAIQYISTLIEVVGEESAVKKELHLI